MYIVINPTDNPLNVQEINKQNTNISRMETGGHSSVALQLVTPVLHFVLNF